MKRISALTLALTLALALVAASAMEGGRSADAAGTPPNLGGVPVLERGPAVAYVGDSITAINFGTLERQLQRHHVPSWRVAAQSGRQSTTHLVLGSSVIFSGLEAIAAMKAAGADPELWVVALGTNDLGPVSRCGCADRVAFATGRIRQVLDAIGPGHHVAWVTVRHQGYPSTSVDFNTALRRVAADDGNLTVIDWYGLSAGRTSWLPDGIHPTPDAADALFALVSSTIADLLPHVVIPPSDTPDTVAAPSSTSPFDSPAVPMHPAKRLRPPVAPTGGTTIIDRCGNAGTTSGFPTINPGTVGPRVRTMQCALLEHGFDPGRYDGYYDHGTKVAVLAFQRFQGLFGKGSGAVLTSTGYALGIHAAG